MYRYSKTIGVLLAAALMFGSCAVYRTKSVSIEEAEKTNKRVLMIQNDDKKVRLKKIVFEDGKYYGVTNVRGKKAKVQLDQEKIRALRPINRAVTTLGNAGFVLIGLIAIAIGIYASDDWGDFEMGELESPN